MGLKLPGILAAAAQPGERKDIVRRSGFVGRGRRRGVVRERRSERGGRAGGIVGRTIGGRTGLRFFVRSVSAGFLLGASISSAGRLSEMNTSRLGRITGSQMPHVCGQFARSSYTSVWLKPREM